MKELITFHHNNKVYTNGATLAKAASAGKIKMTATAKIEYDGRSYGSYFTFETLDGRQIATIYKDSGFGFSSQACDIVLPNHIAYPVS